MKLSGYVCVRRAFELDYCFDLSVRSLIPVCDEVVISVGVVPGEEDDGTLAQARRLEKDDSRVRVILYPWDRPERDLGWWVRWLNWTRERLTHPMQLTLDADEVLDPAAYSVIPKVSGCAFFKRLNYWRDPWHLIPHNRGCGVMVARMGPSNLYMPSDEPEPAVHPNVRTEAKEYPGLIIHHLGFLRKPDAFLRKSEVVQKAFFGTVDSRLERHAQKGTDWRHDDYFDGLPLEEYHGSHPAEVALWCHERGYTV